MQKSVVFANRRLWPAFTTAVYSTQMRFIMRLSLSTIICMLVSIHLLWAIPGKGQVLDEKKVTMEAANATLEKALNQLEKLSGFRIAYASENVVKYGRVSLDFATRSVSATLNALLNQTGLGYKLTDNTIMIVSRHEQPAVVKAPATAADSSITIRGKVTDEAGVPMPGVSVRIQNTTKGVFTDADGNYTLVADRGQVIIFSSVGSAPQEHVIGQASTVNIALKIDSRKLDDVVVVGYGTQRKGNLTGAVSTVDIKRTLESRPITDLGRGLQGAVPGLTITTASGDLGKNPNIRLRGMTGSLNTGSNGAQPLILLDNVEIQSLQMVNPLDVESISVLKDAASTSIYGTRAAWGVILITTKSGRKGAPASIAYANNFSWGKPTTMPTIAPAADGASAVLQALRRTKNDPTLTQFGVLGMYFDEVGIQKIKDWEKNYGGQDLGDEMVMGRDMEVRDGKLFFYRPWDVAEKYMKKNAFQQKHDISVSGGGEKTSYHLGLGYLNQGGMLKEKADEFTRYNASLSVNSSVNDWLDVRGKMILSQSQLATPFSFSGTQLGPWYYLYRWPKIYPYGTLDGKPFRSALTETMQAKMDEDKSHFTRIQVGATMKVIKDLTVDVDYTYSNTNSHLHSTGGGTSGIDFWGGTLNYLPNYQSVSWDRVRYTSTWEEMNTGRAFATYKKDLQDHHIKVIAGMDVDLFNYTYQMSERRQVLDPDLGEIPLTVGDQFVGGARRDWATNGYFARVNYDYKNKFLLELNGRYDGSSRFPENDQYAFFPSISAGYVLTEDKYMDFAKPVLSFLKIRGSFGSLGNQDIGDYRFLPVMRSTSSNWLIGTNNLVTFTTPEQVSPSLTWEKVATIDFGADARFFDNKLGVSFDWYKRTTSSMISGGVTVPSTFGGIVPVRNYGEMQTTGWEVAIDFNHTFDNGIRFNLLGTLSDFREEISRFANVTKGINSFYEGKMLGEIWGYQTDRIFSEADFTKDAGGKWIPVSGIPDQTVLAGNTSWFYYTPGDIKYRDINGDGKVTPGTETVDDPGDQSVIGNSTPRYQYGLRVGADWKGIDLSVFLQGVGKRQLWPSGPIFIPGFNVAEAWYSHQMDYWTPENTGAFYPRPTEGGQSESSRNFYRQSRYLLDMSYLRIKNISLGYTLPASISNKARIKQARIYVSGENLITFDKANIPIDPEIDYTKEQTDRSAFARVYPYRKEFSFGVQITF